MEFEAHICKPAEMDCWIWCSTRNVLGYGRFCIKGSYYGSHRIAWMIKNKRDPANLLVLHRCDNPSCVNPYHLFTGTLKDNAIDMVKKRRHVALSKPELMARGLKNGSYTHPERRPTGLRNGKYTKPWMTRRGDNHPFRLRPEIVPRGQDHAHAILNNEKVLEIRSRYVTRHPKNGRIPLSREFGVAKSTITALLSRHTWKHI